MIAGRLLALRVGQGVLAAALLFLAYWPGMMASVLFLRGMKSPDYAPAYVIVAAIFVIALPLWRNRLYRRFSGSATARLLRITGARKH